MSAPRLDTLNAAQRRTASRSLFIRRARLPRWAVVRIVGAKADSERATT